MPSIALIISIFLPFFLTLVCGTIDHRGHWSGHVRRQSSSPYDITGIQSGTIASRLEWRQFEQNPDRLNLYLLVLEKFQAMDQSDMLSYYQIAGIHGAPYTTWDGVNGDPSQPGFGYCTHASVLFPTWHRPYLALYEKLSHDILQQIVTSFPAGSAARMRFEAAAVNWRLPYWDWANNATIPDIIGKYETVTVEKPSGLVTIHNPLYSYVFHPVSVKDFPDTPFSYWPQTLRWPDGDQVSQPDMANAALQTNQQSLRNRVYNLFTYYSNYEMFSNKAWSNGAADGYDSVESCHDSIHGLVGYTGHMAAIDYAAFDPIFFLHHANVDRLFAMWQVLWPNSFTGNETTQWGTFTDHAGSTEGADTPLTPFYRDNGFWTSNTVKSTITFGYTYPELADQANYSTSQFLQILRSRINSLYGAAQPIQVLRTSGTQKRSLAEQKRCGCPPPSSTQAATPITTEALATATPDAALLAPLVDAGILVKNHTFSEWVVNIRSNKYALEGSFFVHIFLGNFTAHSGSWVYDDNLIGTHTVFTPAQINPRCVKCVKDNAAGLIVSGSIPCTAALLVKIQTGELESLDDEHVIPYLQENLHWRVQMVNSTPIDTANVPNLKIGVVTARVHLPLHPDGQATHSGFQTRWVATDGRPGGLSHGDQE